MNEMALPASDPIIRTDTSTAQARVCQEPGCTEDISAFHHNAKYCAVHRLAGRRKYDRKYEQSAKGKATVRRYRSTEKGRATHLATQRRYAETDKAKEVFREWRARPEVLRRSREATRRTLATDRGKQRVRKWNKSPVGRDSKRRSKQHRRATEHAAGRMRQGVVIDLEIVQRGRCANPMCRRLLRGRYHLDHIVPLSRGGTNADSNLQLLCPFCNLSKHQRDYADWLAEQSIGTEGLPLFS